jgi:NTE family protein
MKTQEVAICLSGGGFRAAAFHLGTLSYLSHLRMADGRTFLSMVNTMSTISGGTITGLCMSQGCAKVWMMTNPSKPFTRNCNQ